MFLPSKADTDAQGVWTNWENDPAVLRALRMNMTAQKVYPAWITPPSLEIAAEVMGKSKSRVADTMLVPVHTWAKSISQDVDVATIGLSSFYS